MMKGMLEKEKKHRVSNTINEIDDKAKANALQKIVQETMYEASTKPKKNKWFDIFKSK